MEKWLLFDFDGVIVDSFNAAFKMNQKKFENLTAAEFRSWFAGNITDALKANAHRLKPGKKLDFLEDYEHFVAGLPIVPGVATILRALAKKYSLAIISSSYSVSIKHFLSAYQLETLFSDIKGLDDGRGKDDKIHELFAERQIPAKDCLYITDTAGDITEARRAGVQTLAVTWGYHDESALARENPVALAHEPRELPPLIDHYFSDAI